MAADEDGPANLPPARPPLEAGRCCCRNVRRAQGGAERALLLCERLLAPEGASGEGRYEAVSLRRYVVLCLATA